MAAEPEPVPVPQQEAEARAQAEAKAEARAEAKAEAKAKAKAKAEAKAMLEAEAAAQEAASELKNASKKAPAEEPTIPVTEAPTTQSTETYAEAPTTQPVEPVQETPTTEPTELASESTTNGTVDSTTAAAEREKLTEHLKQANFTYNKIPDMVLSDGPKTVVLEMAYASEKEPKLAQALPGERVEGQIGVTPIVSAKLTSTAGLSVVPLEDEVRHLTSLAPVAWRWKVDPIQEGLNILWMTITLHYKDDDVQISLKAYEEEINVRVTQWHKLKASIAELEPVWAFFVAAITTISGTVFFIRRRGWQTPTPKTAYDSVKEKLKGNRKRQR